jgi:hypothetical protein
VAAELGQWLAGGRAPERQFTVMLRRRHIDYDLEQLALVHHPARLREVATAITAAAGMASHACCGRSGRVRGMARRVRAY